MLNCWSYPLVIATLKSYPNISAKCVFVCVCVCVCVYVCVCLCLEMRKREKSPCVASIKALQTLKCISCLYYDARYQQRWDRKNKEPTPPNRAARGVLLQNAWPSLGEERHHKMNGNVAERIWTHPTRWIEQWSCSILKEPNQTNDKAAEGVEAVL